MKEGIPQMECVSRVLRRDHIRIDHNTQHAQDSCAGNEDIPLGLQVWTGLCHTYCSIETHRDYRFHMDIQGALLIFAGIVMAALKHALEFHPYGLISIEVNFF